MIVRNERVHGEKNACDLCINFAKTFIAASSSNIDFGASQHLCLLMSNDVNIFNRMGMLLFVYFTTKRMFIWTREQITPT